MKVFINPGHMPDVDPGACGNGLQEADITLSVGQKLKRKLESDFQVELLQSNNICGEESTGKNVCYEANRYRANLFISLHCNASVNPEADGTETFVYWHNCKAELFAKLAQEKLCKAISTYNRGVKYAPELMVLKHTAMPAALIEIAFISNPKDAELLQYKQDLIATAIAEAVYEYFYGCEGEYE